MDSKFVPAYNNRGLAYADSGDLKLAMEDYNKAIELNPNFAMAYYNRGGACELLGQKDKALADYKKAESLAPEGSELKKQALEAIKKLEGK